MMLCFCLDTVSQYQRSLISSERHLNEIDGQAGVDWDWMGKFFHFPFHIVKEGCCWLCTCKRDQEHQDYLLVNTHEAILIHDKVACANDNTPAALHWGYKAHYVQTWFHMCVASVRDEGTCSLI